MSLSRAAARAAVSSSAPQTDHPSGPLRSSRSRGSSAAALLRLMSRAASSCPVSVKTWLSARAPDRDQERVVGMAACLDGPVGGDPGKVGVPELAQHGPGHLVGLGEQRERYALLVAVDSTGLPARRRR